MSLKLDNTKEDDSSQKWFTFYSEKNGRDYYYHPDTKIVTWIRPDDLHTTHATVPQAPQQESTTSVERRVSFHQSVNQGGDVEVQERNLDLSTEHHHDDNRMTKRRAPLVFLVLLLCTLVMTASYMGWLPRGPLGSRLFGNNKHSAHREASRGRQSEEPKPKPRPEKPKPGVSREGNKLVERNKRRDAQRLQEETRSRSNRLTENQKMYHAVNNHGATDNRKARHEDKPKPRTTETIKQAVQERNPTKNQLIPMESFVKPQETTTTSKQRNQQAPTKTNRPNRKRCMIPFAHLVSKKCRKMLARKPVYDMDAFLDSLI